MLRYFFTNEEPSPVDDLIEPVLEEMTKLEVTDESYATMLGYLERLHTLKHEHKPKPVSRDALLHAGAMLLSVLFVASFEHRGHLMTSKAMQFIRPK